MRAAVSSHPRLAGELVQARERGVGGVDARLRLLLRSAPVVIAEPYVSETALSLCWSRRKDSQSKRARVLDARKPQRRFADTRIAFEHECGRAACRSADERANGGEFRFPADNLERHVSYRR